MNWMSKDGVPIPIHKMGQQHLINTVNYLKKRMEQGFRKHKKYNYLVAELDRRKSVSFLDL